MLTSSWDSHWAIQIFRTYAACRYNYLEWYNYNLLIFLFLKFFLLSHITSQQIPFLILSIPPFSLTHPLPLLFPSEKGKPPMTSIKHGISRYHKTTHLRYSKAGQGDLMEEEKFHKQAKESETAPTPIVRCYTRRTSNTTKRHMQRT